MRSFIILTIAITSLLITTCTRDFDLKADKNRPTYVIEGRVSTMKGPYYVRVTRVADLTDAVTPTNNDSLKATDNATPVLDAQVIIWDEAGDADTLQSVSHLGEPRYIYDYFNNTWDSTFDNNTYPSADQLRLGYYKTTHLTGVAGHTYHLKVVIGQDQFEATAYMPPVPELDSAVNKLTYIKEDGIASPLPYAYFKEPQNEKNYYLLQFNNLAEYPYDYVTTNNTFSTGFTYYVVDDATLPAYVNGLLVDVVRTFRNANDTYVGNWWAYSQVRLGSLTKEAYDYYVQLEKQFRIENNVYRPAPTSPVGNISNGAIGLFYASAVSYKLILGYR